jgi:Spy/CpxP family protein refolding chaperone
MRKAVLAISLLSVFSVPALFAQNQNTAGHRPNTAAMVQRQVKRLTLLLDLTPGQQTALTDLFTKEAADNQGLFSSMNKARRALSTAEKNNDSAGIQAASTEIGALTGQMTLDRSNLNAALKGILTSEQWMKYNALGGARGYGFSGRGPGGFAGRPGGPGA